MKHSATSPHRLTLLAALYFNSVVVNAQEPPAKCPAGEEWYAPHGMCMPKEAPAGPATPLGAKNAKCEIGSDDPKKCCPNEEWYPPHGMCMPREVPKASLHLHGNAFGVGSRISGPKGGDALYSTNMFMAEFERQLSPKHRAKVSAMCTTELWSVPKLGVPQPGQGDEGYVNAQHPHTSPCMGVTFSDMISLDDTGEKKLTLYFAPIGEAASIDSFMHRESSVGNPNSTLGHHTGQDSRHVKEDVVGARFTTPRTKVDISAFRGEDPPTLMAFDPRVPNSLSIAATHCVTPGLTLGGSLATIHSAHSHSHDVAEAVESGEARKRDIETSVWASTAHDLGKGRLDATAIWGRMIARNENLNLNSLLAEFSYQLKRNRFYGRVEAVEKVPGQLEIHVHDDAARKHWVKGVTLGAERKVMDLGPIKLHGGMNFTKTYMPDAWRHEYGGNPQNFQMLIRAEGMKMKFWK